MQPCPVHLLKGEEELHSGLLPDWHCHWSLQLSLAWLFPELSGYPLSVLFFPYLSRHPHPRQPHETDKIQDISWCRFRTLQVYKHTAFSEIPALQNCTIF